MGAALDVLRTSPSYVTIAEIVEAAAERHDITLNTTKLRQAAHTAVNNGLRRYAVDLVRDDSEPAKWALRDRVGSLT